ncbi:MULTISPECIES: hypothetical protein [Chryseobacterium group]|nr:MULTISPECIES: hypothetical protein [Chryseobacterium group]
MRKTFSAGILYRFPMLVDCRQKYLQTESVRFQLKREDIPMPLG